MLLIARVTIAGRDCISWEQNASRAMRQSCSRYVPAVLEIGTLKLLFELSIIVEIHTCWKYHFRENRRTCESVKFVKEERQEFALALKSELRYAEKLQLIIRFYASFGSFLFSRFNTHGSYHRRLCWVSEADTNEVNSEMLWEKTTLGGHRACGK